MLLSSLGALGCGEGNWGRLSPSHSVGDRRSWERVPLSVGTPLAVAGEDDFLSLASDEQAWSQEFQKVVFSSSQLKLLRWQILESSFNFMEDRNLLERILERLIWSEGSSYNVGWAACVSGAVNKKAGSGCCCLPHSVPPEPRGVSSLCWLSPAFSFSL